MSIEMQVAIEALHVLRHTEVEVAATAGFIADSRLRLAAAQSVLGMCEGSADDGATHVGSFGSPRAVRSCDRTYALLPALRFPRPTDHDDFRRCRRSAVRSIGECVSFDDGVSPLGRWRETARPCPEGDHEVLF